MNKIVEETEISKGKVHYLITEWKKEITLKNIDEIRDFIVLCCMIPIIHDFTICFV